MNLRQTGKLLYVENDQEKDLNSAPTQRLQNAFAEGAEGGWDALHP